MGILYPRTVKLLRELALGAGFLVIPVAIVVARSSPATGYEASLYASTPLLTWVLLLCGLVVALWTIVRPSSGWSTTLATLLGGTVMLTIASLPILRGYHFLGRADSLTHLGLASDISANVIDPSSLFYPAYHSLAVAVSRFTGASLELAMLVTVVVIFASFLLFVPLSVKLLTGSSRAMGFAAIISWFILPINNISTHLLPHINSLALFYIPVVLFFLILYLRGPSRRDRTLDVTSAGLALAVASVGLLLLHVQHAVNVLLLFGSICVAQFIARRRYPSSVASTHRPLYFQTGLLASLVGVWFVVHDTPGRAAALTLEGVFSGSPGAATTLAQRGGSLLAVGGGIEEIFVKMFLVSAFVGVAVLVYAIATSRGWLPTTPDERGLLLYCVVASVPLGALYVLYFLGTPKMSFRQLGFLYVLLTLLGALALMRLTDWAGQSLPSGQSALGTVLVICLVLSLFTAFGSPYIYRASPGVAEQEIQGFEQTFDTRTVEVPIATLSSEPYRYGDAYYGATASEERNFEGSGEGLLRSAALTTGDPASAYPDRPFYAAVTEADRTTEIEVFDQLNFQEGGLEKLDTHRQSNRILTNGEFTLYHVSDDQSP